MKLASFFTVTRIATIGKALIVVLVGLLIARAVARTLRKIMATTTKSAQRRMVVERGAFYAIVGLTAVVAIHQLGVDLSLFLGAAGFLTVALGFAAQTSTANLISGFFLMAEKPFEVNDIIEINGTLGEVIEVGLISTTIRTFDNRMVRIPNESLMKSEFTNNTRYPIRRVDMKLRVAFEEDLDRIHALLVEVADHEPLCLDEPRPLFMVLGFGESGLDLQFSVWTETKNTIDVRNLMYDRIKRAFDAHHVRIPLPHRVITTIGALPGAT